MSPMTHLDERDRVASADARPALAPIAAPTVPVALPALPAPRALTEAERHGLAMGWVAMALGTLLLLGGLALWAAWAFSAGFWAWLIAVGVMGLVMVAVVVTANFAVLRPRR